MIDLLTVLLASVIVTIFPIIASYFFLLRLGKKLINYYLTKINKG